MVGRSDDFKIANDLEGTNSLFWRDGGIYCPLTSAHIKKPQRLCKILHMAIPRVTVDIMAGVDAKKEGTILYYCILMVQIREIRAASSLAIICRARRKKVAIYVAHHD